jgi:hypothetical protein
VLLLIFGSKVSRAKIAVQTLVTLFVMGLALLLAEHLNNLGSFFSLVGAIAASGEGE